MSGLVAFFAQHRGLGRNSALKRPLLRDQVLVASPLDRLPRRVLGKLEGIAPLRVEEVAAPNALRAVDL